MRQGHTPQTHRAGRANSVTAVGSDFQRRAPERREGGFSQPTMATGTWREQGEGILKNVASGCFLLVVRWGLSSPGQLQAQYIANDDLELLTLLTLLAKCLNDSHSPARLVYVLLGIELSASCMPGGYSPN